jgi:16S rRNA C967 or C1407 C5-methylase (RsmB/RsmF family)
VYSTCSCSTLQNDDVVRAAVLQHNQQQRGRAAEAQQKVPLGPDAAAGQQLAAGGVYVVPLGDVDMPRQLAELLEGTSLGMISLPDTAGHGPIYAAVLEKLAA